MDEYGVDLEEINRVIEQAEILVVRFQIVEKRLLVDFRTTNGQGPLFKVGAPVASAEERFRSLRALRPAFPAPDRILSFLWPRGMAAFEAAGTLGRLRDRLLGLRFDSTEDAMQDAVAELLHEERVTLRAAIRGGEGFQTIWERSA